MNEIFKSRLIETRHTLLEVRRTLYAISIQIPEAEKMVDDALKSVVECEKVLEDVQQ